MADEVVETANEAKPAPTPLHVGLAIIESVVEDLEKHATVEVLCDHVRKIIDSV